MYVIWASIEFSITFDSVNFFLYLIGLLYLLNFFEKFFNLYIKSEENEEFQ